MKKIKQRIKNKLTDKAMLKYPVIVSNIRSGTHFLVKLAECYTNKKRFSTTRKTLPRLYKRKWAFVQTHFHNDWNLSALDKIEKRNIPFIYLYREDYLSVAFSKIMYDLKRGFVEKNKAFTKKNAQKHIQNCKEHINKFTNNPNAILIKYEDLIDRKKRLNEFRKVIEFLGYDYKEERAREIFMTFSGINLADNHNKHKDYDYEKKREWFRNKFKIQK